MNKRSNKTVFEAMQRAMCICYTVVPTPLSVCGEGVMGWGRRE